MENNHEIDKKYEHLNVTKRQEWWNRNKNFIIVSTITVLVVYILAISFMENNEREIRREALTECNADPKCQRAFLEELVAEPVTPNNSFGEFKTFETFKSF